MTNIDPAAAEAIKDPPVEFAKEEIAKWPMLRFFHYSHLPEPLQARSKPFCELARHIMNTTPDNEERHLGLHKLKEAKDCIVRAALP